MAKWIVRVPYEGVGYIPIETEATPGTPEFKALVHNRIQIGSVHTNKPSSYKQEQTHAAPVTDEEEYARLIGAIQEANKREGINVIKPSTEDTEQAYKEAVEHYSMDMMDLSAEAAPVGVLSDMGGGTETQSPVDTVMSPYNKPTELEGDDLDLFEEIVRNIVESNGFQDIDVKQPFIVRVRGKGSFIKSALRNAFPKLRNPKAVAVMRYGTRNCGVGADDIKAV